MSEIYFNAVMLMVAVLRMMLVRGRKSVVMVVQWC